MVALAILLWFISIFMLANNPGKLKVAIVAVATLNLVLCLAAALPN